MNCNIFPNELKDNHKPINKNNLKRFQTKHLNCARHSATYYFYNEELDRYWKDSPLRS